MTLQVKYKKLENDCFNLLTVDPNPPLDLNHFSLILRLEDTVSGTRIKHAKVNPNQYRELTTRGSDATVQVGKKKY